MSKLNVKSGTPVGNVPLCQSCRWGQFMTGYRDSEVLAICTNTNPNMVLPFTVYECTEYSDKHKPDWEQMEKLAIQVLPTRASSKTAGFSTVVPARRGDEDEDEDEAARAL
jgi:hypothetical protein